MSVEYIFFGKVHPERCNVWLPPIETEIVAYDGTTAGKLRYYISASQVVGICVRNEPAPNVYTLKNYVEDVIRSAVDAVGYVVACGYDLEITQTIDSLGSDPIVFGVGVPGLENEVAAADVSLQNVMQVFRDDRGYHLQRCLADLREAIRAPKDTGFFCYRAIESLRQFFVREGGPNDKEASWELLRSELTVERADIDSIKRFADPIRHGEGVTIAGEERAKVLTLAWRIVGKFVKYANTGYTKI